MFSKIVKFIDYRLLCEKFEVNESIVLRWINGVARPHPRVQKLIINYIKERLNMNKITLLDWITSSNNHPERASSGELTDLVKSNAQTLCDKVNSLLDDLNWQEPRNLTSGFRTQEVNQNTPGASLHSGHEGQPQGTPDNEAGGLAMDLWDDVHQTLCKLVSSRPDLLRKYDLFMEDMKSTKGNTNWCHIDFKWRPDRASRTFIP